MDDYFDDFDDGDFMGDSFEDSFEDNYEAEDSFDEDPEMDNEPGDFTAKDAFFVGSIVGNAYEEGLDGRRRRELLRKKQTKRDPTSD